MAWDIESEQLVLDSPGVSVTPSTGGTPIDGSEQSLGAISGSFFGFFAFQCNNLTVQIGVDISLDDGETWDRLLAGRTVLATNKITWSDVTPFAVPGGSTVKVRAVAIGSALLGSIQVQYVDFFRRSV